MSHVSARLTGAGLLLLALGGCATSIPSRFYMLASAAPPRAATGTGQAIGLGPIAFPQYLDRPEITTRQGEHQIRIGDLDRWAEPLEGMFGRELALRLQEAGGRRDVVLLPAPQPLDLPYAVEVEVTRFDADQAGEVTLDASWRVLAGEGGRLVKAGRSVIHAAGAPPPDYPAVVGAMNHAVGDLAREIAAAVPPVSPSRRKATS